MTLIAGILGGLTILLALAACATLGALFYKFFVSDGDWPTEPFDWFMSVFVGAIGCVFLALFGSGAIALGCNMIGTC